MKFNRRNALKYSLGAAGLGYFNPLMAEEDKPNPKSNRFVLQIDFGSSCGAANGLLQPASPGKWPLGFFNAGVEGGSANALLNSHTAGGNLMFHDYIKFMAAISQDICLCAGTSQTLDHLAASQLQKRGTIQTSVSPEWSMGVAEFMKSPERLNPLIVTSGSKSASVADISTVQAGSMTEFKTIMSDDVSIPRDNSDPILNVLKSRFANPNLGSVETPKNLGQIGDYQLNVLKAGIPSLEAAKADIAALTAALSNDQVKLLIAGTAEKTAILSQATQSFRDQLILAGILAKTGLGSGMSVRAMGGDLHVGGSDVLSAREAGGRWALVTLFWQWVRSVGLQEDVMIVAHQEFARSPYNLGSTQHQIVDASGATKTIAAPGRDHALCMGMMFINANVPKAGRVGFVGSNMVPQATKDAKGTIDPSGLPYTSDAIVGSMLMRVYPDLFPTERMVRKHWPTFKEIDPILS
jgi:hypothetical protein